MKNRDVILDVRDLRVEFDTYGGVVKAVRGVNFKVHSGETLAIVGESGCGKSVTVQSILGLIPTPPGRIASGSAKLLGKELMGVPLNELNKMRGREVGFIFQDPMTSLNPTMTIGEQISEALYFHKNIGKQAAREKSIELLRKVQIPEASTRVDQYPFEFSGGMRQRVMIAMAIACEPKLLIADEPTTALDVTIQSQILQLLKDLQKQNNMALVLITHDLGVVARMADRVNVMYAGQVIESGSAEDVFYRSSHPYTVGLKSALPSREKNHDKLIPIEGSPPDLFHPPKGCGYYARCPYAMKLCEEKMPPEFSSGVDHFSRCWLLHGMASGRAASTPVFTGAASKESGPSAKSQVSARQPELTL
jgi:oligopeptide/dipeptide ABC transporter ATP-binding protein